MKICEWEQFEETIAQYVFADILTLSTAIGQICREHPQANTRTLLLAAISFTAQLDLHPLCEEENALEMSIYRYRVISVLAADVALLARGAQSCADLQDFWEITASKVFIS